MGKLLVALALIMVEPDGAAGQALQIDPARDRALHATVQAFLDK